MAAHEEELQVLDAELVNCKRSLHSLLVAEAYERVPLRKNAQGRPTHTLLDYTQKNTSGRDRIPGGEALQRAISAEHTRLALLENLYADYQKRHEAELEAKIVPAEDPQEAAE